MELVNESGGLALSFNGEDFAVRGSNVAVLSNDCTVAAVILQAFYNEGIEAVLELAGSWDRRSLKELDFPDRYLMDAMLAANPKKLPEVYAIDRKNVDEISKKSAAYRRKMLGFRSRAGRRILTDRRDVGMNGASSGFEPECRPRKGPE